MKVDPRTLCFVQCPTVRVFHYRVGYWKKIWGLGREGVLKYTLLYSRVSILQLDISWYSWVYPGIFGYIGSHPFFGGSELTFIKGPPTTTQDCCGVKTFQSSQGISETLGNTRIFGLGKH